MHRSLVPVVISFLAVVFVTAIGAHAVSAAGGGQETSQHADRQALVNRYCVSCHNDRLETGGFTLESLDLADIGAHPEA